MVRARARGAAEHARARRLGARRWSRSVRRATAVVDPGERAAQGPGRRPRVRHRRDAKDGKPRAQLRRVTSGPVLGDEVVIVDGLAAGETVAASGSFKLREGVLVAIAEPESQAKRVSAR